VGVSSPDSSVCPRFDYLEGISRRAEHPHFEEVEIVALFRSRGGVEVVRQELEADIVRVGHDTLVAWPKWYGLVMFFSTTCRLAIS